jgi:hypothetical protein
MGGSRSDGLGFMLQDLWGLAVVLMVVIGLGLLVAASWFANRRR